MNMRRQAGEEFRRLHAQAVRKRLFGRLIGQDNSLLSLYDIQDEVQVKERRHAGIQLVPIRNICGSEGRAEDFDADFRPLQTHNRDRWVDVAVAHRREVAFPPVELVQVNDHYFVRDGHHRISVAKLVGQVEVEAEVTVWRSN
jgi:hypothetical protein